MTRIMLDVDGPLHPYLAGGCPEGWTELEVDGEAVWLWPEHGEMLTALAVDLDAELWWATAWGDQANEVVSPVLGLAELPVVEWTQGRGDAGVTWKLGDVAAAVVGHSCVWVDDFLCDDAYAWADERTEATLLVRPDAGVGLTAAEIEEIREWAS